MTHTWFSLFCVILQILTSVPVSGQRAAQLPEQNPSVSVCSCSFRGALLGCMTQCGGAVDLSHKIGGGSYLRTLTLHPFTLAFQPYLRCLSFFFQLDLCLHWLQSNISREVQYTASATLLESPASPSLLGLFHFASEKISQLEKSSSCQGLLQPQHTEYCSSRIT